MLLLGRKEENVNEEGLNVQLFINDTYCSITKAASQERSHDNFIGDHCWEILNLSLLTFFDINDKSNLKIKKKSNLLQGDNTDNFFENNDEVMLSTSAKAFSILSHASNTVVQCLTNKKYFYYLASVFLRNQIKKKKFLNEKHNSFDFMQNDEYFPKSTSNSSFSESTELIEKVDDDLDEKNWLLSSEIIINRLASIFQNIIEQDSDHLKESAQLLIYFLPFSDEPSVFDLFSTSCSESLLKPNFFHHLTKIEIVDKIISIISSFEIGNNKGIDETKTDNYNQDAENLISNSLSILSIISRNKYLIQNVNANNKLFSLLSQFASLSDIEISIKNSLWKVISAICNAQAIKNYETFFKCLFFKAMKIVSDPYTKLNIYHTYVIDFLTKIMKFIPKFFIEDDSVMLKSIIEVISRLIAQFPDSTNFQSSIARFIISSIENYNSNTFSHLFTKSNFKETIILEKVVKDLLPLVIVTAQSKSVRSAAAANCVSVMYRVSTLSNSNSIISQFCNSNPLYKSFMKNFMNDYKIKLGSNYGGPMNEEPISFKNLNKFANEIRMNQNHLIFV